MQDNIVLDVNEDDINQLNRDLLSTLLFDRTTRKNILWGTDDYKDLGDAYAAGNPITEYLITGCNGKVIQPRVLKAQEQKKDRTRARAEVFTPSWVCNAQNNLVDAEWFGGESPFNEVSGTEWKATTEPIHFAEKGSRTWKKYVDCKRLEITCGEAPYLVSRYDTVTGQTIPVPERIGLLDRKLRVVCENTESKEDWKTWARRAVESVYGYEFQGDNLLLARENVLYTYIEYYRYKFEEEPVLKELLQIALVISWNLWQMDGFNYAIPYCEKPDEPWQLTIFDYLADIGAEDDFDYSRLSDTKGQELCKIRDWRSKETILFKKLVGGSQK